MKTGKGTKGVNVDRNDRGMGRGQHHFTRTDVAGHLEHEHQGPPGFESGGR